MLDAATADRQIAKSWAREKLLDRGKAAEWRSRGDLPRSVHRRAVPRSPALGGSDGGTPEHFLDLLVPEGLACLAIAYWGTSDTQSTMAEIPLERLERGLRWLIGRSDVVARDGRVAVVGASRGGELVLLLAASFPDLVGPVVPSDAMFPAYPFDLGGSAIDDAAAHAAAGARSSNICAQAL